MDKKLYTIGGKKFTLKPYEDLTGFEDEEITRLMGGTNDMGGTPSVGYIKGNSREIK